MVKTYTAACAPPYCACPTLTRDAGEIFIEDDFGGAVRMTEAQFESLVQQSCRPALAPSDEASQ